ncbi:S-layer homology domain-containing protein [Candidatus Peregrinibacteria bacterium]|nr:S-layer homology domain-containing protein [Candidatus Peregrinibacteria bacterium]
MPNGGGQCEKKAVEDCPLHLSFDNNDDCWKRHGQSNPSLSRCKEVKELWDQGNFTARFGNAGVLEGGVCRARYFGKGWNVNIHHNTDSRRTLEYCRKIKEIFADEGNWTPRFGGIEEPFKCKTLYYTQNWREKSTATLVNCYAPFSNGGGRCMEEAKEDCASQYTFRSNADCQNYLERKSDTISCCKKFSAGVACEQYPSTDSCADWGGEVYSSCNECFAERDPEPETISCCKKFSSGVSCEQYPSTDSCADWGGVVYSSCNECFAGHDPLPPAGYEDEVLVNFDAYDNPFPDTSLSTLEGRASAELYRRAVIGGFPDGEFKGDRPVNRAEAAKFLLLARFGEISNVSNSGRFPDVLDGQWYTKYVVTAANKGIISGHPDGTFKPADGVNTAEFLKMLTLTFDLQTNLPFSYRDVSSSDWFSQYAGIAKKYNLFPDRTSYLSPARALTRSEVSVAIYQFLQGR